ncbi:rab guanine nucleotide exchange factor S2 [Diaporthe australafricana]|uniref:Rab guanine nucleotide exchange factor S2 n=1 Tax=Diaporthe australafricana TaxID=127596 RepID=A0ABR3VX73_9PEZI
MAADASPLAMPVTPQSQPPKRIYAGIQESDFDLTTIPDPRSRAMTPINDDASGQQHPELNDEVAHLSSKLIHAINHQTTLDDNLSQTRAELERAREQIQSMEVQLAKQREMLVGDIWIRRKSAEAEKTNLLSRVAEEKRLRLEAEDEKKRIEQELENLTTELFEEANKMVISAKEEARKEQDVLHRKNSALKAQLADTEGLLQSQQEQLIELKHVMEQMSDQDNDTATTTPSSPGYSKFDSRDDDTPTSELGSQNGLPDLVSPSYPTSFTHLLQPVLRNDIGAYDDFVSLCKASRTPASRPPSGNHTTLGLGLLGPASSVTSIGIPSSASTASLSSMGSPAASSTLSIQTPNTPGSTVSGMSTTSMVPIPPLKDCKFYKRVLAEDVEPTLRLDMAPGLSWLARRSVISAMSEGSLVVEPVPTTGTYAMLSKPQFYPCSLCGEHRKDDEYLRRYRFRTSESSSSQRYPLCRYCLSRVRATCDFLGFLRIVKDGHWRTDDEDAEKSAWEESVRLRENMFWSRIGGGVRPILQGFHGHSNSMAEKSPRPSQEEPAHSEQKPLAVIEEPKSLDEVAEISPEDDDNVEDFATPLETTVKSTLEGQPHISEDNSDSSDDKSVIVHEITSPDVEQDVQDEKRQEVEAIPEPPRTPEPTEMNRLSSQSLTPTSS